MRMKNQRIQKLKGILKVGYTAAHTVQERVAQQYPIKRPGALPYRIVLEESAMKSDGSSFTDHDVHALLEKRHFSIAVANGIAAMWLM
jgi:hypothetical protein